MPRPRTIAIVANEFFAAELGRMGGFGWAAKHAALALGDEVDVLYLSCEHRDGGGATVHGRRFVPAADDWGAALRGERIDAFLTIDYRPSYEPLLRALPRTPLLVWVRDPRPPEDLRKLATLRVPGDAAAPQGVRDVDCTSLAAVARIRRGLFRRRVAYASPAPRLATAKAPATYGVDTGPIALLPNPVPRSRPGEPAPRPRLAFLGRLDPIKRPWVAVELARALPDVELVLLGQPHFEGPGSWQADDLPENVRLLGHLEGERRDEVLRGAWLLVNTSIHEALPVSFLEALALGVPIVSCQDPEGLASRFGRYVGRFDGDGLDSVPSFAAAVRELLDAPAERRRLGEEGRVWVEATHTPERFASTLRGLLARRRR